MCRTVRSPRVAARGLCLTAVILLIVACPSISAAAAPHSMHAATVAQSAGLHMAVAPVTQSATAWLPRLRAVMAAVPASAGDPANGEALFTGERHLQAGGPPCLSCHNIDSTGILGGGTLGPDLTQAVTIYGENGLASALADIPWPTMRPIFADHPLTPAEQADLQAFLVTASTQPETNRTPIILALSLAGLLAAGAGVGFIWRRRLRAVRSQLVAQARARR